MEQFKPFLNDFIKYYYEVLGNSTGGRLHICLDDGNLNEGLIFFCQEDCREVNDTFGQFLAELMMEFTKEELEEMYAKDWWGMDIE